MLYRSINVCRRLSDKEAVMYRCFELLPGGGFVVQSADWVRWPAPMGLVHHHEWHFWKLFCELPPEDRATPHPSLEEAIAAFEASLDDRAPGKPSTPRAPAAR